MSKKGGVQSVSLLNTSTLEATFSRDAGSLVPPPAKLRSQRADIKARIKELADGGRLTTEQRDILRTAWEEFEADYINAMDDFISVGLHGEAGSAAPRGPGSPRRHADLHEPRDGLLGPSDARRRPERDQRDRAPPGSGRLRGPVAGVSSDPGSDPELPADFGGARQRSPFEGATSTRLRTGIDVPVGYV